MLIGEKVLLRAWIENDVEPLCLLRNDVALQSLLMTQSRPNSVSRVREWLHTRSTKEDGIFFVIANKIDEETVGFIQIQNMKLLHGTAELGICLLPKSHGHGFGKEALILLENYLRNTFNMRKLRLHVLSNNKNAIEFYKRTGFSDAGRLKQDFYQGGLYQDVIIMEKMLTS